MTRLTFETATLADVIKRAAAVSPTRGDALDRTAGVIFKINPADGSVTVMSTDTTVFYMESVAASIDVAPTELLIWRLPAIILSSVTSKLPVSSGSTVVIDDDLKPPKVVLKCGRTVVELNKLDVRHYPPLWSGFDPTDLRVVPNFGLGIKQVLWAASNSDPLLSSVAIYPDGICTTDKYRMARVEMDTGLQEMVIVPGKILSRVIPENGDVSIGVSGNTFLVSPNPFIQISTVMMNAEYPPVGRVLAREFDSISHFNKSAFGQMVGRASDFAGGDRQASLSVFIGRGEIALHMDNSEVGLFGDVINASGSAEAHRRLKIDFAPANLRDAIGTFPGDTVSMCYNLDRRPKDKRSIKFTNQGHYSGLVQPLVAPEEKEEDKK